MSKKIDTSKPENLSDADLKYLLQRDPLPRSVKAYFDKHPEKRRELIASIHERVPVDQLVHTGTVNSSGLTQEEYDEAVALLRAKQEADSGEVDDEEEVDYSTMTNDELRAELASRELSVEGKKDDLIARLEEDDASDEEE